VEYSGFNGLKITTGTCYPRKQYGGHEMPSLQIKRHYDERTTDASSGNARIRSEERPGGPGYVKIPGWLFEKAAGF
jgi:hypothetical protein